MKNKSGKIIGIVIFFAWQLNACKAKNSDPEESTTKNAFTAGKAVVNLAEDLEIADGFGAIMRRLLAKLGKGPFKADGSFGITTSGSSKAFPEEWVFVPNGESASDQLGRALVKNGDEVPTPAEVVNIFDKGTAHLVDGGLVIDVANLETEKSIAAYRSLQKVIYKQDIKRIQTLAQQQLERKLDISTAIPDHSHVSHIAADISGIWLLRNKNLLKAGYPTELQKQIEGLPDDVKEVQRWFHQNLPTDYRQLKYDDRLFHPDVSEYTITMPGANELAQKIVDEIRAVEHGADPASALSGLGR